MKNVLPKQLMSLICLIGRQADSAGISVFLIGGMVRDIALGEKNYDLDIVVEGDAIQFAKSLSKKIGGALVVYEKFGTASIVKQWPVWLGESIRPDNKFKIDIASARKEVYERPAALPRVQFSSLREDLFRRDFTINAMAININKKDFGQFIDFFGGINDLKNKCVRALHEKSFIDDPTRIFRAVRFEQRFGFKIEKNTEHLIKYAIKREMFKRTENQRIRDELILMLKEANPEKAVFRMRQLDELRFIHPALTLKKSIQNTFVEIRKAAGWYKKYVTSTRMLDVWLMNFMVMLDKLTFAETEEMLRDFVFTSSESKRILSYKKTSGIIARKFSLKEKFLPSQIYFQMERLSDEEILCAMAKIGLSSGRSYVKNFLTKYRRVKLKIKGYDIKKAGILPGPVYKEILEEVLRAKLDGKLRAKKDELKYMRQKIKEKNKPTTLYGKGTPFSAGTWYNLKHD
ncbi:MAG: CCA tRNA nucleotidyltransferase [Candidatus Omnitrophota bacterium]